MSTWTASAGVNTAKACCKDRYFRAELEVEKMSQPVWLGIRKVVVLAVD